MSYNWVVVAAKGISAACTARFRYAIWRQCEQSRYRQRRCQVPGVLARGALRIGCRRRLVKPLVRENQYQRES
jgi:hypothetical protein